MAPEPTYRIPLTDALDGLYAYAEGATDSGISDPALRTWAVDELRSWPTVERERLLTEMAQALYIDDEGYGDEDRDGFVDYWLDAASD